MKAFISIVMEATMACGLAKCQTRSCDDDDVLVQIHAASVNPVDLKIRDGKLKLDFALSPTVHFGQ